VIGIGALLVGVVPMVIHPAVAPASFRRETRPRRGDGVEALQHARVRVRLAN